MAGKIKNKNHKGASKRFKITKAGKVKFSKTCNNHLLTNKDKNHKKFPYGKLLRATDAKNIKNLVSN